jgi:hypothetical protein
LIENLKRSLQWVFVFPTFCFFPIDETASLFQEGCWDASTGSVQDSVAKTQSREVGARKRERAMAYAFSKQVTDLHPYTQILPLLLEFLERNLEQVTFSRICAFPHFPFF